MRHAVASELRGSRACTRTQPLALVPCTARTRVPVTFWSSRIASSPCSWGRGRRRRHADVAAAAADAEDDGGPPLYNLRVLGVFGDREALASIDDLNQLQTALTSALNAEDYSLAALIRDRIKEVMGSSAARIDWEALGVPSWISDRAERLGFRYPSEIQRRATPVILGGLDTIIQSETGSGKTLAFLVPSLATLEYPPDVFLEEMQGPQAIVVVPSMELGVQCALTVYKLYGGNLSQRRPGDAANMFTYTGPKGIKVRGLLNKEEVAMATGTDYLKGVHVVVATPAALMEVYSGADRRAVLDHLKILVVDEFDECFRAYPEAMMTLMSCACKNNVSHRKPQVVLVGATITSDQIQLAAQAHWIQEPVHVRVGDEITIPSGLQHRYVVCEEGRKLAVLAKLLRKDLEDLGDDPQQPARAMVFANSVEEAAAATEPLRTALWGDHQMSVLLPPGTRIPPPPGTAPELTQDGDEAKSAAMAELAGSSPFSASDPIRAMHSFRDNRTSLLLCTPNAARGLDLPAVSHVYNLGAPTDITQYLHRAGRAGRIGSTTGGIVTSIVTEEELPALLDIAQQLHITITPEDAPGTVLVQSDQSDVESLRKGLEDVYNLL